MYNERVTRVVWLAEVCLLESLRNAGEGLKMTLTFELPSDCRGDGFDVAVAPHSDDKQPVEVFHDRVIVRTRLYVNGCFCGYHTDVLEINDELRELKARGYRFVAAQVTPGKCGQHYDWQRAVVSCYRSKRCRVRFASGKLTIQIGGRWVTHWRSGWSAGYRNQMEAARAFADLLNS